MASGDLMEGGGGTNAELYNGVHYYQELALARGERSLIFPREKWSARFVSPQNKYANLFNSQLNAYTFLKPV